MVKEVKEEKYYWILYSLIGLILFSVIIIFFWLNHTESAFEEISRYFYYKSVTYNQISDFKDKLVKETQSDLKTADNYPIVMREIYQMENSIQKFIAQQRAIDKTKFAKTAEMMLMQIGTARNELLRKYQTTFGHDKINSTMEKYRALNPEGIKPEIAADKYICVANTWELFKICYLAFMPIALIFFVLRLKQTGFKVILEFLAPWKIILATLAYPIGIFRYPTGDPGRQLIAAMRFVVFAILTIFTSGIGIAGAQAKSKSDGKKKEDETSEYFEMDYGIDFFSATIVPFTDKGLDGATLTNLAGWHLSEEHLGKLSGVGFVETRKQEALYTFHQLNYHLPLEITDFASVSFITGYQSWFAGYTKLGSTVELTKVPLIKRVFTPVFKKCSAGIFQLTSGLGNRGAIKFNWLTKSVDLGNGFKLFSKGFYNYRYYEAESDYARPGVWFKHDSLKHWSIGTIFELSRKQLDFKLQRTMLGISFAY